MINHASCLLTSQGWSINSLVLVHEILSVEVHNRPRQKLNTGGLVVASKFVFAFSCYNTGNLLLLDVVMQPQGVEALSIRQLMSVAQFTVCFATFSVLTVKLASLQLNYLKILMSC